MVRTYAETLSLEEAVEKTIEECIQKDILSDFLKKNRAEAMEVCLYEYNEEQHLKEERDIAKEEGIRIGQERGEEIGQRRGEEIGQKRGEEIGQQLTLIALVCKKMAKNYSVSEIADMLETDENTIQTIYDAAKPFSPDFDTEEIWKSLRSTVAK